MPNMIEYAKIYQTELDRAAVQDATSGWMEGNAGRVKYSGGREIKIPKMTMDGPGDYDRSKGYPEGSVSLEYQTREMKQDRGRKFTVDAMDVDESGFLLTAPAVMGEFQRTKVVPELDAYRYSTICKLAQGAGNVTYGYTPAEGNLLSKLQADITKVADRVGSADGLIITMPFTVAAMLDSNDKIRKTLSVVDFTKGEVTTKVQALDSIPIIRVQSGRFKTAYTFLDGRSEAGEKGWLCSRRGSKAHQLDNLPPYRPACRFQDRQNQDFHTRTESRRRRVDCNLP